MCFLKMYFNNKHNVNVLLCVRLDEEYDELDQLLISSEAFIVID